MNIIIYLHEEPDASAFEDKIKWLQKRYKFVGYEEIVNIISKDARGNWCHLTVDDGGLTTYSVIYPVLKKFSIPATIFVSPKICREGGALWFYKMKYLPELEFKKYIIANFNLNRKIAQFPLENILKNFQVDKINEFIDAYLDEHDEIFIPRGFINMEELLELNNSGLFEIGAHTLTHPILANESDERSRFEITESIIQLSNIIKKPIRTFAIPNGLNGIDFSERELKTLHGCEIETVFTVNPGWLTTKTNLFLIPRICSFNRLRLGKLGVMLPSIHNQAGKRAKLSKLL